MSDETNVAQFATDPEFLSICVRLSRDNVSKETIDAQYFLFYIVLSNRALFCSIRIKSATFDGLGFTFVKERRLPDNLIAT